MGEAARRKGGRRGGGGEPPPQKRTGAWGKPRERERERPPLHRLRTFVRVPRATRVHGGGRGAGGRQGGGREGEKWLSFFPAPTLSLFLGTNSEGREGRKLRNRATERERALGGAKGGARRRRLARRMHSLPADDQISLSLSLVLSPRTAERRGCLCSERGVLYRSRARCGGGRFPRENPPAEGGGAERALRKRGPKER